MALHKLASILDLGPKRDEVERQGLELRSSFSRSQRSDARELHGCDFEQLIPSPYLSSSTKKMLDRVGGVFLLLFFSIVLLVFAIAIVCTSRGPALFIQRRYGRDRAVFSIFKLRSMRAAVAREFKQAERGDPRITKVGHLIRKTSIDELPQLINVVRGEMSLVGPRPHPIALDELYSPAIKNYERRFDAAPGMTGLAQVSRARGETPTVAHMRKRIEFDLMYVQQASLYLDLKILLLTAREVFFSPTRDDVF